MSNVYRIVPRQNASTPNIFGSSTWGADDNGFVPGAWQAERKPVIKVVQCVLIGGGAEFVTVRAKYDHATIARKWVRARLGREIDHLFA